MSSLMQFEGKVSERGVHLMGYLVAPGKDFEKYAPEDPAGRARYTTFCDDVEPIPCTLVGPLTYGQPTPWPEDRMPDMPQANMFPCCYGRNHVHPNLYTFVRKPIGMWGCWVVFRYNNEEHVPDLSIPLRLRTLPRDAKPMDQNEAERYWHS